MLIVIDDTRDKPQCACIPTALANYKMTKYDPTTHPMPLDRQAQDVEIANTLILMKEKIDEVLRIILGS